MSRSQLAEDLRTVALTAAAAAVVLAVGGAVTYARAFILKQIHREMLP